MPVIKELDFTCSNCGEHSQPSRGTASAPGEMFPPYDIKINGSSDLSNCIQWNDRGKVYRISVVHNIGPSYSVHVDGEGPHGWRSGSGYLRFIDYTGDHYDLSLFRSSRDTHSVEYISARPGIKTILWSNESF